MEVSSRTVAEVFGKPHKRVLHAIAQLEIPEEIGRTNFRPSSYTNAQNKTQPEVIMTRDGFSLLCMGFTGAKAMQWKLKFLAAFNAMEAKLVKENDKLEWNAARLQIKAVRKSFTNAVQDFVAYATEQGSKSAPMYYANITKMEYKALDLLDKQKSAVGGNFRDTLDLMDISALTMAEVIAKSALESGMQQKMHYKEIYQFAKQKVNEYAAVVSMPRLKP
jgi:Rha family phage regulatory protein